MIMKNIKTKTKKYDNESPKRNELRTANTFNELAIKTEGMDVVRETTTNCPDNGRDIVITGYTKDITELTSILTNIPISELPDLSTHEKRSRSKKKIEMRIDVKSGETYSADLVQDHSNSTSKNAKCAVHIHLLTHPNVVITDEAESQLEKLQKVHHQDNVFMGIAKNDGIEKVKDKINKLPDPED